jgi:type I restriction enzyme S subunit
MEVKLGYKKTEVGVIPGEWEAFSMADNSSLKARIGWQGLTTAEYLRTGDYYLVTGTDFASGRVNWASCCFVTEQRYAQDRNIQLRQGDILLTKDGTIGKVGYIDSLPGPATLNSGVFVIRPKNLAYNPKFFYYILSSRIFDDFLGKLQAGSTISHLYQKDFISFSFLAPSFPEQTAIAGALGDVDALVRALERLIAKKRDLKQAAMQQLLTGQTRLPGFTGEWEHASFGSVLRKVNSKEYQIQTAEYQTTGIFPIVDQGKDSVVGFSDREDKRFRCPEGGVIVFGDHTCIVKFVDFDFVVGADGTQILTAKAGHNARFHAFHLQHCGIATTGYNRHFKFLKERPFVAPPLEEQTTIAGVLSDMDAEITALEQQLAKTRALKQGMMQELLTGRVRLI